MKKTMGMGIANAMATISFIACISNTVTIPTDALMPTSHYSRPTTLGTIGSSRGVVDTRLFMFDWVDNLFGDKKKEEEAAATTKAEAQKKAAEEAAAAAEQAAKAKAEAEARAKQKDQEDAAMVQKAKADAEAKFAEFEAQQKAKQEAIAAVAARAKAEAEERAKKSAKEAAAAKAKAAAEAEAKQKAEEDAAAAEAKAAAEAEAVAQAKKKAEEAAAAKVKAEAEAKVDEEAADAKKAEEEIAANTKAEAVAAAEAKVEVAIETEGATTTESADETPKADTDEEETIFNAYIEEIIEKNLRIKGIVQWYNPKKGFGFIKPFETPDEEYEISKAIRKERTFKDHDKKIVTYSPGVYVHQSSVCTPDETFFRKLYARESVELELSYDDDGRPTAKDVTGPGRTNIQYVLKELLRRKDIQNEPEPEQLQ